MITTYDLQYYFSIFIKSSILNKYSMPSTILPSGLGYEKSFIQLLFDNEYSESSYRYLYRELTDSSEWPSNIRRRLMVKPSSAIYYVCDSDDTSICDINLYNLVSNDLLMLDNLLLYRQGNDSTSIIENIIFENLESNLSKMIYIYLNFKINNNYLNYDLESYNEENEIVINENNISITLLSNNTNILEMCYELYLIEQLFEGISAQGI